MSALTAHIRVLRALGEELGKQAEASSNDGRRDTHGWHDALIQNGALLGALEQAMRDTAAALEAEDRE
jgi:hypothetical protein